MVMILDGCGSFMAYGVMTETYLIVNTGWKQLLNSWLTVFLTGKQSSQETNDSVLNMRQESEIGAIH